jgi:hypothetical protein
LPIFKVVLKRYNMILRVGDWMKVQDESFRREQIRKAVNSAQVVKRWDYTGHRQIEGESFQSDWNQTLISLVNQVAKEIDADTIITSPEVNAILSDSQFYTPIEDVASVHTFFRAAKLSKYTVYVECYLPASLLIVCRDDIFTSEHPVCGVIYVDNISTFTS